MLVAGPPSFSSPLKSSRRVPRQHTDGSRLAASSKIVIRFIVFFLSLPVLYWTVTVTLSPACHCAGVFSAGRRSSKSETADA